jgi:hypothetical protein
VASGKRRSGRGMSMSPAGLEAMRCWRRNQENIWVTETRRWAWVPNDNGAPSRTER